MPQKWLSIKNFDKYQSFTKKNPPWFKLHRSMFGDPEFMKLSTHHRYLYVGLIHLAVECNNRIYNDPTFIGQRLYISSTEVDLKPLYRSGFLLTSNLHRVLSETEKSRDREETDTSTGVEGFDEFWKAYPRKVGKEAARRKWVSTKETRPPLEEVLKAIEDAKKTEQWQQEKGKFIPHPATWLNQGRWADVHVIEAIPPKPQLVGGKAYQKHESASGGGEPMPEDFFTRIGKPMPTLREA